MVDYNGIRYAKSIPTGAHKNAGGDFFVQQKAAAEKLLLLITHKQKVG